MRRPYAAPRIVESGTVTSALEEFAVESAADFAAKVRREQETAFWLQYMLQPLPATYTPPRSCLQCGCDGQRGSFHE